MTVQEEIIKRISERLKIEANLLEGGFAQDIIGSISYELANITETELNRIADRAFVTTAEGEVLEYTDVIQVEATAYCACYKCCGN